MITKFLINTKYFKIFLGETLKYMKIGKIRIVYNVRKNDFCIIKNKEKGGHEEMKITNKMINIRQEHKRIQEGIDTLRLFNEEGQRYFYNAYCKMERLTKNEVYWLYAVLFMNYRLYSI